MTCSNAAGGCCLIEYFRPEKQTVSNRTKSGLRGTIQKKVVALFLFPIQHQTHRAIIALEASEAYMF